MPKSSPTGTNEPEQQLHYSSEPSVGQRPPVSSSHRIPSLDGLRAISILVVVAFHVVDAACRRVTGHDYSGPLRYLIRGELGVSVFFVISGFLITDLLLQEKNRTGKIDLYHFYVRRAFRIWPAFYAYLGTIFILGMLHWIGFSPWRDFLPSALFVFNYTPKAGSPWLGQTWSLAVEEQFYLLWPAAVILLTSSRIRQVAFLLLVICPLMRFAELFWLPADSFLVTRLWEMTHTRIDTLMFGRCPIRS
jgi:peptidoglycan/LPS O-acetylase OafA/YrhL